MKRSYLITAVEIARAHQLDAKRFRAALRAEEFSWHAPNERWQVPRDSDEHLHMIRVAQELSGPNAVNERKFRQSRNLGRDEDYIVDLCDKLLKRTALRQHSFPFLLGDVGNSGRRTRLPVDAYYPDLHLVIEYHERQHSEAVYLFDKKQTISGVSRAAQRRLYDLRRHEVLPQHGITLLTLNYREFNHNARKRLIRSPADHEIISGRLAPFLA